MPTLTNKKFIDLKDDNEKIGSLRNQTLDLQQDFEDMKRTREEARKQLEARFEDVYRKINNTKEFVVAEGKRINGTLLAFQSKFDNKISEMHSHFTKLHDSHVEETRSEFKKVAEEVKRLDKRIDDEREERLKQQEETFREIKEKLAKLDLNLAAEQKERIKRDEGIMRRLEDEVYKLKEDILEEKDERALRQKEIDNDFKFYLAQQDHMVKEFHQKTIQEFNHVATNLQKEMLNRIGQQDQVLDNLSNIVKTMQDTLKELGKDA
jgi:SF-assemblin/beta giardin